MQEVCYTLCEGAKKSKEALFVGRGGLQGSSELSARDSRTRRSGVREGKTKAAICVGSWQCWMVLPLAKRKEFNLCCQVQDEAASRNQRAMKANKLQFHQVDKRDQSNSSQSGTNLIQGARTPESLPYNPLHLRAGAS